MALAVERTPGTEPTSDGSAKADELLRLGDRLSEDFDIDGAVQAYRTVDEMGDGRGSEALGDLLYSFQRDGAEEALRRADDRGSGMGSYRLGHLLEERGDLEAAEAAYLRADARDVPVATYRLAELRETRGDLESAEATYQRAAEHNNPDGGYKLALMRYARGDREGAEMALERAVECGSAAAACWLGELRQERGDLADAEESYRRADDAGHANAAYLLGTLLAARGETADADAAFRRAAMRGHPDSRPRELSAYQHCGLVEVDSEDAARAAPPVVLSRPEPPTRPGLLAEPSAEPVAISALTVHQPGSDAEAREELLAVVNYVRSGLQWLREATLSVAASDPSDTAPAVRSLQDARTAMDATPQALLTPLREIRNAQALIRTNAEIGDRIGALVFATEAACNRIADVTDQLTATRAVEAIDEALEAAAWITVPSRLAVMLRQRPIGGAVDFHRAFADEIPSGTARRRFLTWLKEGRGEVGAVVEDDKGKVYRLPSRRGQQLRAAVVAMTPVVAGAVLWLVLWLLTEVAKVDLGRGFDGRDVVLLYVCVLSGALVHIGLVPKTIRFDTPVEVREEGAALAWVSLRMWSLVRLIIPIVAVAAALWLADTAIGTSEAIIAAVLAGYTADSLWNLGVDRFATRAESAVNKATEATS